MEGNTLNSKEIFKLVEQATVTGNKEMRHYLEVQGYSLAARWVYEQAVEASKEPDYSLTKQHISHIHQLLMSLVWGAYPPVSGDKPGQFRTGPTPKIRGSSLKLPVSSLVPTLLKDFLVEINAGPGSTSVIEWASIIHAQFEAIHPFIDGNGRTGRLLMNFLLI
ncbi:MAG: Fic family protein, partial [Carboxydocellales bacterium]